MIQRGVVSLYESDSGQEFCDRKDFGETKNLSDGEVRSMDSDKPDSRNGRDCHVMIDMGLAVFRWITQA